MAGKQEREQAEAAFQALLKIESVFAAASSLYNGARYADALETAHEGEALSEALVGPLPMGSWPLCLACGSTGEILVGDSVQKTLCANVPSVCLGNRYGRMAPEQLAAFIAKKLPVTIEAGAPKEPDLLQEP